MNASSSNRPPRNRNPPSKYQPETGLWTKTPNADQNLVIDEDVNTVMIPSSRHNEPKIVEAKVNELNNWKLFEVMDEVEDLGQKTISTRWVISEKESAEQSKIVKARLVVRGFEEDKVLQVDSPTVNKTAFRLALAISAHEILYRPSS